MGEYVRRTSTWRSWEKCAADAETQGTKFSAPVTIEARSDGWVNRDEITSSGGKKQT